jgi:hypothetical protein
MSVTISIFSIIQFLFLRKWKQKVNELEESRKNHSNLKELLSDKNINDDGRETISFTNLFYDIVKHMENIKIKFYLMNIISIIYLFWSFRFILMILLFPFFEISFKIPDSELLFLIRALNISSSIIFVGYLIYMWYHFLCWNNKLKKLEKYEKMIVNEIEL